jgi:DNA repair exonuclease SbcCD ATPase subunit
MVTLPDLDKQTKSDIDNVSSFADRSEKSAWQRKRDNLDALTRKCLPLEQQLIELTIKHNKVQAELSVNRAKFIEECHHPEVSKNANGQYECEMCGFIIPEPHEEFLDGCVTPNSWWTLKESLSAIWIIEEDIRKVRTGLAEIRDQINQIRADMTVECVHPADQLTHHGYHIECNFCHRQFRIVGPESDKWAAQWVSEGNSDNG